MSALVVENLSYRIGGRTLLDGINLTFAAGEIVALIGPNGAGKSTLIGALAGDLAPSEGRVFIDGQEPVRMNSLALARKRAVLLQQETVAFSYTAQQVVQMGRTPWRGTSREAEDAAAVSDAMAATETTQFAQRDVTTLSGGENGRVQLARVLAQHTPLLILDEPTAAMDIRHQEFAMMRARSIADSGGCVIVVLHDIDVAAAYADRIVLMESGRVVADGSPDHVCDAALLSRVYQWEIDVVRHPLQDRLMVVPRRGGPH